MKTLARDLTAVVLIGLTLGLAVSAGALGWLLTLGGAAVLLAWAATRLAAHLARREARRIAAAYDAGYDEGWDAFGRHYNAAQVRWSA